MPINGFVSYVLSLYQNYALLKGRLKVFTSTSSRLVIIIVTLFTNNVEEFQAVFAFARANYTKPIAELLLLEEFLRQVLQVSTTEFLMCNYFNTSIAQVGDCDSVTEVARSAVDFDALL